MMNAGHDLLMYSTSHIYLINYLTNWVEVCFSVVVFPLHRHPAAEREHEPSQVSYNFTNYSTLSALLLKSASTLK